MAPENEWLEYYSFFLGWPIFRLRTVSFREYIRSKCGFCVSDTFDVPQISLESRTWRVTQKYAELLELDPVLDYLTKYVTLSAPKYLFRRYLDPKKPPQNTLSEGSWSTRVI